MEVLSKLTTAGVAGQFRTPRHVIRAMVEMLDVQPTETVCDQARGARERKTRGARRTIQAEKSLIGCIPFILLPYAPTHRSSPDVALPSFDQ